MFPVGYALRWVLQVLLGVIGIKGITWGIAGRGTRCSSIEARSALPARCGSPRLAFAMANKTEQRIRARVFADVPAYDHRGRGGFAPLPLVFRRCLHLFTPRTWQIYTYFLMRTGPDGLAWPTIHELGWDLGFGSVSKLKAHVKLLLDDGWLVRRSERGRDYYALQDPLVVLARLRDRLPEDRAEAIEELLETLKLPKLAASEERAAKVRVRRRRAKSDASASPPVEVVAAAST